MKRGTILIVDDEPHIVQVLAVRLREAGFEVVTAADGCEALDRVREQCPDLVISDLQMPRMDGTQLCRHLREDPRTSGVPVLIVTARGTSLDALQLPADVQVVGKPFSPRRVVDTVARLLESGPPEAEGPRGGGVEAA